MSYNAAQKRDPKGSPTGGQWSSGDASSSSPGAGIADERTENPGQNQPPYNPNVHHDADGDGVSDAARVGVPAHEVPPPPQVPRLPNLTPHERAVESAFADAYQRDPDGMARKYLDMVRASKDPSKFEADMAKNLFEPWAGKGMSPEARAEMRSTMNTPLHQTANAIAKRAFLMYLDEMNDTDRAKGMLVTVGGCGSGKGYTLKTLADKIPELNQKSYGVTWDSAGDQNATENPWLLKEASKRGIPVTYVYVSADPKISWADPKRGVVQRAMSPEDGRMVDAQVFADSYVIGAKNHAAFSKTYAGAAKFIYLSNGGKVEKLDRIPDSDINRNRQELHDYAVDIIHKGQMPRRVRRGALLGQRIW